MIISAYKAVKGMGKEISEDSYHVDSENGIFIVADGMYGDGLGKVASQTAVQVIASSLKEVPMHLKWFRFSQYDSSR